MKGYSEDEQEKMAITYNIAKCRNGWGVYARAISGIELRTLVPTTVESVLRVKSGRLARKRSKQAAKSFVSRIMREPPAQQIGRLQSTWLTLAPHDYQIVSVPRFTVFREFEGQTLSTLTTTDLNYAETVALHFAERGLRSFLRRGVTQHLKLPLKK
jgi:hypothetical protein